MDDEVEDIVGDVKYTDSQKSVTTSAVYSLDFTDSSSDKNNSSGKETYVIDYDSDDSDKTFQVHKSESVINLINSATTINVRQDIKEANNPIYSIGRSVCTSLPICNIQEIFTQTSKTIIELAQNETNKSTGNKTLETQTSYVSITENKSIEYKIQIFGTNCNYNTNKITDTQYIDNKIVKQNIQNATNNLILANSSENKSFDSLQFETDKNTVTRTLDISDEDVIHFIEDESRDDSENKCLNKIQHNNPSEFESTNYDSDIENDSLMENEYCDSKIKSRDENSETSDMLNSADSDVEELYNRLSENSQLLSPISSVEPAVRNFSILTPLTEETVQRKDSIVDLTPSVQTLTKAKEFNSKNTLFVNNSGLRVTVLSDNSTEENNNFKLPPIHKNQSCPNSARLNFLFTLNNQKPIIKARMLPSLCVRQNEKNVDRWEIGRKELASGESPHIVGKNDSVKISKEPVHLPSIHLEDLTNNDSNSINYLAKFTPSSKQSSNNDSFDTISIQGKIKELKMIARKTRPKFSSRSGSPTSASSPDETRVCDTAEKGCELLCAELLRRLRSSSWVEITDTLDDLPKALEKFWSVITENRIADLLRQDFYECMSTLLAKTGSYNRPVRREANVALDDIVCSVDVTHCVTAICIYGVSHKSVLVRCASARLLVVCCALAEGGRQILRTRPPSAAAARKHTLRSLAELLQDKYTDTRKYAERLYAILRPLPNFEAYFLTDVDVELASKHMKKYDQLLINSKTR